MTVLISVEQQSLRDTSSGVPLSMQLREATATPHLEVERVLGLPGAIRNLADYERCLRQFYRLYQPLEAVLGSFNSWQALGIDMDGYAQSGRLAADLRALGVDISALGIAPQQSLPRLPDFAHALGALYVLEGSTLGAQYILPSLVEQLGSSLDGATSFFSGHGARNQSQNQPENESQTGASWKRFREALDRYGVLYPESRNDVVEGAQSAFAAVGSWMKP